MNWMSVKKQLPPTNELVWVYPIYISPDDKGPYAHVSKLIYKNNGWYRGNEFIDSMRDTHYWYPWLDSYSERPPYVSNPAWCPRCQSNEGNK